MKKNQQMNEKPVKEINDEQSHHYVTSEQVTSKLHFLLSENVACRKRFRKTSQCQKSKRGDLSDFLKIVFEQFVAKYQKI